jgi:hypothetical protein
MNKVFKKSPVAVLSLLVLTAMTSDYAYAGGKHSKCLGCVQEVEDEIKKDIPKAEQFLKDELPKLKTEVLQEIQTVKDDITWLKKEIPIIKQYMEEVIKVSKTAVNTATVIDNAVNGGKDQNLINNVSNVINKVENVEKKVEDVGNTVNNVLNEVTK